MLKKLLLVIGLSTAVTASAINTIPACGKMFGTLVPNVDLLTQPAPAPGLTAEYIKPYAGAAPTANTNGQGQTRIDIDPASYGNNDPLVNPGLQNANHGHVCWGNPLPCIYSKTNLDLLRNQPVIAPEIKANIGLGSTASETQTTSEGGTVNLSAYWAPYFVDTSDNSILPVSRNLVYYKTGITPTWVEPINSPVNGLKMLTGDSTRTTPYTVQYAPENPSRVKFTCYYPATNTYGIQFAGYIPPCDQGGQIKVFIWFPTCVQTNPANIDNTPDDETGLPKNPLGMVLDSPDHKSHLAWITAQGCPKTPVNYARIPEISFNYTVDVTKPSGTSTWALSSDNYVKNGYNSGASMHADYTFGWRLDIMKAIVDECLNANLDCHAHNAGTQKTLYKP